MVARVTQSQRLLPARDDSWDYIPLSGRGREVRFFTPSTLLPTHIIRGSVNNVKLEVKPADQPSPEKAKLSVDPTAVVTVIGILSKLPISDLFKGILIKLFIFAFGIFCGIGIVYKSGLQPTPAPAPAANVSTYQKRIDELAQENAVLHKLLEEQPAPVLPPTGPPRPVRPSPLFPFPTPTLPDGIRPGVIIPLK